MWIVTQLMTRLLTLFLFIFPIHANAQQSVGRCSPVVNSANDTVVNVYCRGESTLSDRSENKADFNISVEGVISGTRHLTIRMRNRSKDIVASLREDNIFTQDSDGRALQHECSKSDGCRDEFFVLPGREAVVSIVLEKNISRDARSVSILIKDIKYRSNEDAEERLLGFVSWDEPVLVPRRDTAAEQAAETALGLTCFQRYSVEVALVTLGFKVLDVDGTFSRETRQAIRAWQEAGGRSEGEIYSEYLTEYDLKELFSKVRFGGLVFRNFERLEELLGSEVVGGWCPSPNGFPEIEREPTDEERKFLQRQLQRLGFYRGGIDGEFGAGSQTALDALTKKLGLEGSLSVSEALLLSDLFTDLPDAPNCTFSQGFGSSDLMSEPSPFSQKVGEISGGRHRVIDQSDGLGITWFLIGANGTFGWVLHNGIHTKVQGNCFK